MCFLVSDGHKVNLSIIRYYFKNVNMLSPRLAILSEEMGQEHWKPPKGQVVQFY